MNSTEYYALLRDGLKNAYAIAQEARSQGYDPTNEVEVKIAKDVAARVEGIVGPPGIAEVIRTLESSGMSREDISFEVARKMARGEIIKGTKEQLIEQAVRTGLCILTEGVLVAPTEGIAKVKIKQNPDGSDYVAIYYTGPIRSAGGTAVALSLVLADIARRICGVGDYRPTETQIMRINEEILVYENRCVHLQYLPSEEHIRIIVEHCPICVDGEPTEDVEVSAYRDVPGIETNRVRSGVALVICDSLALKAAKVLKITRKLKLNWDWLEKIIKIKKSEDRIEVKPDPSYLEGLVAGRPVFSHASAKGGFRLRYGRSKTNGLMARNIHPAIMVLLDNFPAYGTHMKVERPGKGCVVAAHEDIEPPVVRLHNGRVMKVRTLEESYAIKSEVAEVLFLGDMLTTYGDFLKSNHPLLPSGYCVEWWLKELEEKSVAPPQSKDASTLLEFSKLHNLPLHPDYTYHWHDLSAIQMRQLADWLKYGQLDLENGQIRQLRLPLPGAKRVLEELLFEHRVIDNFVVIAPDDALVLLSSVGAFVNGKIDLANFDKVYSPDKSALELVNLFVLTKAKAPTYIGARMGRPEKAKERKMDGSPHVLFPTGSFKNRSILKLYRTLKTVEGEKTINIEVVRLRCTKCNKLCFFRRCDVCGSSTQQERVCPKCGRSVSFEMHCEVKTLPYDRRPVDIVTLVENLRSSLGTLPEDIKGVKGLSNAIRIPESLKKGFLRARNDVYVFRDGTSRFDATDIPLTHFTPHEIGITLEQAHALGYSKDYLGKPLENELQLVCLHHQDIILAESGVQYFMKVAAFLDDMLINIYGMKPFYNIKTRTDLLGHLFVGLSPHTSAGALCRVIGFTKANVGYAHPYFHTAKRRNCFQGDEKILVHDGKEFKLLTMRDLVENNLVGETKKDDFGTEYKKLNKFKTFAFNKKTKKFELAEVTHVSKHKAPKKLIQLKTKSGRKITVTPDHPFPNKDGEKICAEDATEILIPWNVENVNIKDVESFPLLSLSDDSTMVRTEEDVFDEVTSLSKTSKELGISYKTFTNYVYRKSYPLNLVQQFNPRILREENYLLGGKRDHVSIKPKIDLSEDFMSLLGFYLAEGYIKKNQPDTNQVSITATKKWATKLLKQKIKSVFGVEPSVSGNAVTICSSFILRLFDSLGIGKSATTKRIPNMLYSLPPNKIAAFLRGYFSGDGSCSLSSTLEVNVTSVNKWLIDGVSHLLMFLGIRHSIYEEDRLIKSDLILKFYGKPKKSHSYKIRIYGDEGRKFIEQVGFLDEKQKHAEELLKKWLNKKGSPRTKTQGDIFVDKIVEKKLIENTEPYVYSLTVDEHHSLICSGITSYQCDGDEDCVMLLLDALINFSKQFLDERRGGTMDTPLVLSIEINPKEVDDEAHNIEFVSQYPLEFYRAAERIVPPSDVKLKTVKDVLGTEEQYELPITHPGGGTDVGVIRTAYVELDSVPEKIEVQFALQDRIRAVDKRDAAERLILSHFIPDLYGNLRSYSRQTFRCVTCNTIYRRVPLAGKCSKCGGNLLLTINKGGIQKYLSISEDIVKRYDLPLYLKQRLELVEKEIKSVFEDDKVKQTGLADFL